MKGMGPKTKTYCGAHIAPESGFFFSEGFHRNAKIARGMNPATPFPPLRVGAVQAEVL